MAAPANPTFGQFVAGEDPPIAPASAQPAGDPQPSDAETLRSQVADRDETIRQLAARPAAAAPAAPPPVQVIEPLGTQPDPTTHPAEFSQWLSEDRRRSEARTATAINQTRDAAMQEVRARDITNEFMGKHPEYASMVSDVRQELANAVTELGYAALPDDATQLHTAAEKKLRERAARYTEVGTIRDGVDPAADPAAATTANRTGGVAGATTAAAVGREAEPEKKVIGMIDALKEAQSKNGFF